ncbi:MAG: MATE family efflux transporter [bacterium]|nr:MATE family efflux transporter [bacterium]
MKNIVRIGHSLENRWYREGGYREVLKLALPLILSTGSTSLQHFVDRMFLTWYSPEAIAASVPCGILSFTLMCLFIGTAAYVNPFVAQYYGAKQNHQIGPAVWQGIYFAIFTGFSFFVFIPAAQPIFNLIDHEPAVKQLEIQYFRILCLGAPSVFIYSAVAGFFSGRGETWTILWVNFTGTVINLVGDYLLIFGSFGLPELGIRGAGIATVISHYFTATLIFLLMLRPQFRQKYGTWRNRRFDREKFKRLMRFGLPNGVHFMLDLLGFTLFILLVGRFGAITLAATNITFNINSIAFMPMVGLGIAVEIIVGQRLGENRPKLARYGTYSALHITILYMGSIALTYVIFPTLYLLPFAAKADPVQFREVTSITIQLLKFVAFYSLFDTLNIIFSNALRGAGDTRFVMFTSVALSWIVMIIPTYFATVVYRWGLITTWIFLTGYIVILGIIFYIRFLGGKWESMRVIEEPVVIIPHNLPENPTL